MFGSLNSYLDATVKKSVYLIGDQVAWKLPDASAEAKPPSDKNDKCLRLLVGGCKSTLDQFE